MCSMMELCLHTSAFILAVSMCVVKCVCKVQTTVQVYCVHQRFLHALQCMLLEPDEMNSCSHQ